jgi:hydroxymethylbilane synthase
MSYTVYISRELDKENQLVRSLAADGFEVVARAMISTEGLAADPGIFRSGWIFFSSKEGVKHFFASSPNIGKCQLAAIGEGTARVLSRFGTVDFIGQSSDTAEVASAFKKIAGRKKVFFPVSDHSVRTVQAAFPASQVTDIVCYKTTETPGPVGHPDILVFSSPSNVEAYLKANSIIRSQRLVAFGKTTGAALEKLGFAKPVISKGTSDSAILDAIKEAASG